MRLQSGIYLVVLFACASFASAELVAIGQFGYHPSSAKQVVSYGSATSGTFSVKDASTNAVVYSGVLAKARDFDGNPVECQGNNPCLVGDFSSVQTAGTYYIATSLGGRSPNFVINENVFSANAPVFLEFFDAQMQQGSAYHADMNKNTTPLFTAIADGSFLMEADQAALTTIRLGSAYRENPQLFATDKYTVLAAGKPDMQEYLKVYTDYLASLQGVAVENRPDQGGFRISQFVKIENAFTPGTATQSSVTIYDSGHTSIGTVAARSLCGADDGSAAWDSCIDYAARYYKCQVGEYCLNMTYTEQTGYVVSQKQGFDVSKGWSYEFGCYTDIPLSSGVFNDRMNPCLIFHGESSADYTAMTLLAFAEAIPAVHDYDAAAGQALFERAVQTQRFYKENYALTGDNAAFYGAALFLLYDYSGDVQYLRDAHALRTQVSNTFISDRTRPNEFYWEEYARHKTAIVNAGLQYQYNADDAENFFRGKIYGDYKDQGERSMSKNSERVFIFDNNVQFSNSRFILTEGVLAAKASSLYTDIEPFIPLVADNQLAWMTGMNGVQNGTDVNSNPLVSYSFIFGIGNNPSQFHSRYLLDTGYKAATGGAVIGARSTGFFWNDNSVFREYDGTALILGQRFGALGNQNGGETYTDPFNRAKTFTNGKKFIPGWINGAFDSKYENDIIYNYRDNLDTWEMTETTNEVVATAIELTAYLDARYNNKPRASVPHYSVPPMYAKLTVNSNVNATISLNGEANGRAGSLYTLSPGTVTVTASLGGATNSTTVTLTSGETRTVTVTLGASVTNGTLNASSTPSGAALTVNGASKGNTPQALSLTAGTYTIGMTLPGYQANSTTVSITAGQTANVALQLYSLSNSSNETCYNNVQDLPVSCTGTITADVYNGCRQVSCSNGTNSLQALACDKGTGVEVYKQSSNGAPPKICFGSVCIQNEGFVATNYPVCVAAPACTPSTEVCDGRDNNCNGQIDENNVCAPTCTPTTETCNGVDDNCNGQIDENNVCSSTNTCYSSAKDIPASCTGGTITTDNYNGCRQLICTNGASSLQALACDKGTYFEMYQQSKSGTLVTKLCIGDTCIGSTGYAKSGNFPLCTSTNTCTPTTEICDGKDNNCNGAVDENNVCAPTCTPTTETCNGVDDNCNGLVDENNVCSSTNTCYNTVKDIPITCSSGSVTQDTWSGCRFATCSGGTGSISVQACDKSGYFEIYRKSVSGSVPKLCFGSVCMQSEGYVKSTAFPVCTTSNTCTPTTEVCDGKDNNCNGAVDENNVCGTTCTPTTEVCNGVDDNCNGAVDENNVCTPSTSVTVNVAQWYPKGREYLFECKANGFTPTTYSWNFGNGVSYASGAQKQYYTYPSAGSYTVTCTAKNSATSQSGTLVISVV